MIPEIEFGGLEDISRRGREDVADGLQQQRWMYRSPQAKMANLTAEAPSGSAPWHDPSSECCFLMS